MIGHNPMAKDLEKAKVAVRWDDETSDNLLESIPTNNSPDWFFGTDEDIDQIRQAMKRYEEQEAEILEDKAYNEARFRLQFIETNE